MTIKVFGNIDRKEQKDRQKGTERQTEKEQKERQKGTDRKTEWNRKIDRKEQKDRQKETGSLIPFSTSMNG